jgi:septal ring factor EnvC (AmiA/AmiB activator)
VGELAPLLGGGSVFGVLALVIAWLLKSNRDDRDQAEKQIDAANKRASEARAEVASLELLLDAEQERRRKAEDDRSELAREVKGLRSEVAKVGTDIEQIRAELP